MHMHIDNSCNLGNNIYVIFSNILGHYVLAPLGAAVIMLFTNKTKEDDCHGLYNSTKDNQKSPAKR